MPHREGQRFDDYQLLRLLGTGSFGEVYAAEHIYDHEQVALKIIKHQLSPTNLKEFLREARTIRLKHPHIVPLLDFGIEEAEQLPFLAMLLAPNGTLLQRHQRGTRLDLSLVVTYVDHIASALHYAHERRLIHRDVKPENVLLGAQNELLLSDFGIVAIAHSEHSMRTQDVVGTATYMAPEQIKGKPQPASDQYALAVMTYEWLCGTPPFRGSQLELFACHVYATPDAPRSHNPQLPQEVEIVLLKALAKDPSARFPTIQAFAQAFSQANPPLVSLPARLTPQPTPNATKTKEDWLNKGNELHNFRRYEEALDAYNRAIQLDPSFAFAYSNKGKVLRNLKRYGEALEAYNHAIALDPNLASAYNNKGKVLFDIKRCEEALDAYNRAIQLDPNYVSAYTGKGLTLATLKRFEEALNSYNRAIRLDPNFTIAYNNKGNVLADLKRHEEALDSYNRAIQLDSNDAVVYYNKGNALMALKHFEEALASYNRAIQLDPNYTNAYNSKGIALKNLKRFEEALDAYNRAIQLDPNDAVIYHNAGYVLDDLKRYEEALAMYNRAIELDPNFTIAYNNKGLELYNLKRYEEALATYNRAIELDPNLATAYHNKGSVLNKLKRRKEARAAFAKARELGYKG